MQVNDRQIKFWFDHRRRVENHGTYKPLRPGSRSGSKVEYPGNDNYSSQPSASHQVELNRESKKKLIEAAKNLPTWMHSFELLPLMSTLQYKVFPQKSIIIEKGEYTDDLYFLLKGEVTVIDINGNSMGNLCQGSYFGEMGAIDKGPRTATCLASTVCHVFVMSGENARRMLEYVPKASRELLNEATKRILELLKSYETKPHLNLLSSSGLMNYRKVEAGGIIIREGDFTDDFYFLSKGTVEVRKQGKQITTLNPGTFFGEMSALCPGARTTTVESLTDCEVFVLPGQILRTLAEDDPSTSNGIGETLRQVVFARASDTMMALTNSVRPINADIAVSSSNMKPELKMALFQLLKCIHNVTVSV